MNTSTRIPALALLLLGTLPPSGLANEWLHYRGPHRNGQSPYPSNWATGQPWLGASPLWSASTGQGGGAPVVSKDHVFVFGWEAETEKLSAINRSTGAATWVSALPAPAYGRRSKGDYPMYKGPSSTPEIDATNDLIFTLGNDGDLVARALTDGSVRWQRNLYDEFAIPQRPKLTRMGHRDYGYTTAPFLSDKHLLVEVGDPKRGTVLAVDPATGTTQWWSEHRDHAGHTGGFTPLQIDGHPCVVWMTISEVVLMQLDSSPPGKTLATWPFPVDFQNNTATLTTTPAGHMLVTAGYNQKRTVGLQYRNKTLTPAWETAGWFAKVCPPVVHRDRVFFSWQKLRMISLSSGGKLWEGGRYGDPGSLIVTPDDKLIVYGGRGIVDLYDLTGPEPRLLEHRDLGYKSDAWPHVVFTGQHLLTRDRNGHLDCWPVGRPQP